MNEKIYRLLLIYKTRPLKKQNANYVRYKNATLVNATEKIKELTLFLWRKVFVWFKDFGDNRQDKMIVKKRGSP